MPDCLHNGYNMNIDGFLQPKTNCDFAKRQLNTAIKTSLKTWTFISAISYSLSYSAFSKQFSLENKNATWSQFYSLMELCYITIHSWENKEK